MIIFPKDSSYNMEFYEFKLGKDRLKMLEKALRILGNFDEKQDIIITHDEYITWNEIIYQVIDKNNTSFRFSNFSLGRENDPIDRYQENFILSMQKEKSNIEYKYDFTSYHENKLVLTAIRVELSDTRTLAVTNLCHFPLVIMEENQKKYTIAFNNFSEDFSKMIQRASLLETLNVENVLKIIDNPQEISSCTVYNQKEELAQIRFMNGNIYQYDIIEPNREITVTLKDEIKRKVKRKLDDGTIISTEETITDNYQKIQSESCRLLKKL